MLYKIEIIWRPEGLIPATFRSSVLPARLSPTNRLTPDFPTPPPLPPLVSPTEKLLNKKNDLMLWEGSNTNLSVVV